MSTYSLWTDTLPDLQIDLAPVARLLIRVAGVPTEGIRGVLNPGDFGATSDIDGIATVPVVPGDYLATGESPSIDFVTLPLSVRDWSVDLTIDSIPEALPFFPDGSSIWLITLELGGETMRFSTADYHDADAGFWSSRVTKLPNFDVQVGCAVWGRRSSYSLGSVEIADPDEAVDWWDTDGRDTRVELAFVNEFAAFSSRVVVARALVDSIERANDAWTINLRGTDAWLDRPVATSRYVASDAALVPADPTFNRTRLAPEVVDNAVAVVLGRVNQIEPALVSPPQLIHQISDASCSSITTVYSGGSIATTGVDYERVFVEAGIRWLVTPSARVLIDCDGVAEFVEEELARAQFGVDAWPSEILPPDWSVSVGTPIRVPGVGLRFAAAGTLTTPSGSFSGRYVVVLVYILDMPASTTCTISSGAYSRVIERVGRHAVVIGDTTSISIAFDGPALIAHAAAYGVDDGIAALTLRDVVTHLTVARAGLLPASITLADVITATEGGFATGASYALWTPETVIGGAATASVTHNVASSRVEFVADSSGGIAVARLLWNEELSPGAYTLSGTVSAVSVTTSALAFAAIESVASGLVSSSTVVAFDSASGLFSVRFRSPVPFRLVFSATTKGASSIVIGGDELAQFNLDDCTLTRSDYAPGGEVDLGSLDSVSTSAPVGVASTDRDTVADALTYALSAAHGWYYVDPLGRIAFGRLVDPDDGVIYARITSDTLEAPPSIILDPAEKLSDRWAGGKNWRPYTDSELAGIAYPDRPRFTATHRHTVRPLAAGRYAPPYTHALGAEPIASSLHARTDLVAESDRISALYGRTRRIVECRFIAATEVAAATIEPGFVVQLDADEFGELQGAKALVIGVAGNYRDRVVTLTLWV